MAPEPQIQQRAKQPYVAIAAHVPTEAEFRKAADKRFSGAVRWLQERGVELADNGSVLRGCIEHYRIGPVEETDYSKWETEVAYLTTAS